MHKIINKYYNVLLNRWISLIILMLLTLNCNAQKDSIMKEIPQQVDADFEVFDKESFFPKKDSSFVKPLEERKSKVVNNDTINIKISANRRNYEELDKYNRRIKDIRIFKTNILEFDLSASPFWGIRKEFYPTGEIKEKGIYARFGFKIRLWYYYDEEGNLVETIDHDKEYEFTTEDIFDYCERNGINLLEMNPDGRPTVVILKQTLEENKPIWVITYPTNHLTITIVMDGKTGQVIKRYEQSRDGIE